MNCAQAGDAILVADISELHVDADTVLAAHIRECMSCARTASVITRGTGALSGGVVRRGRPRRMRVSRVMIVSTLPIAAAVGFFVITKAGPGVHNAPSGMETTTLPAAHQVSLDVARGQQATVFKTADPNVTVIWLSSGEGK
jgi:hypothetical protein